MSENDRPTLAELPDVAEPSTLRAVTPVRDGAEARRGEQVGNYRVIGRIGEGGMGIVFLAEHPSIGKRVAVKVLRRNLSADPEMIGRFLSEARAVNAIGHPHIVDIFDFGMTASGEHYFAMELLDGEPLSRRLERGPLTANGAVAVAAQMAAALSAAHTAGIIHRDVKPENLFLLRRAEPFVKILDFGIAKLAGPAVAPSYRTVNGAILGTPHYMSPEQCAGRQVDHRSDVYSTGVVLFEMLTGRLPFAGEAMGEIFAQHLRDAPPDPRALARIDDDVAEIVLRALAKAPGDRFSSMDELRRALLSTRAAASPEPWRQSAPSADLPPSPRPVSTTLRGTAAEMNRHSTVRRATAWGMVALAVAVAGAIAVHLVASGGSGPRDAALPPPATARAAAVAPAVPRPVAPPATAPIGTAPVPIQGGRAETGSTASRIRRERLLERGATPPSSPVASRSAEPQAAGAVARIVASDVEGPIDESKLTCLAGDEVVPCGRIRIAPGERRTVHVHADGYRVWIGTLTPEDAGDVPITLQLSP